MTMTACDGREPSPVKPVEGQRIACALENSPVFEQRCSLLRRDDLLLLTEPDGGFRRLRIIPGGLEAADGAERAQLIPLQGMIEVRIGDDAYRLPAQTG